MFGLVSWPLPAEGCEGRRATTTPTSSGLCPLPLPSRWATGLDGAISYVYIGCREMIRIESFSTDSTMNHLARNVDGYVQLSRAHPTTAQAAFACPSANRPIVNGPLHRKLSVGPGVL